MKNAEQVLLNHPDHPGKSIPPTFAQYLSHILCLTLKLETLALKALILSALKKKKEAFDFI